MEEPQDRRSTDSAIIKRIDKLEAGHKSISKDMAINTAITKEIQEGQQKLQESTEEVLALITALKGGIKTASWIGKFIKWTAGIVTGLITIYLAARQWLGH